MKRNRAQEVNEESYRFVGVSESLACERLTLKHKACLAVASGILALGMYPAVALAAQQGDVQPNDMQRPAAEQQFDARGDNEMRPTREYDVFAGLVKDIDQHADFKAFNENFGPREAGNSSESPDASDEQHPALPGDDNAQQPMIPDDENGTQPPAKPDGDSGNGPDPNASGDNSADQPPAKPGDDDSGTQPAMPSDDDTDGNQPPAKPDDDTDCNQPPAKPDDNGDGDQPPALPDGDKQMPPAKHDRNGDQPPANPDGDNGMPPARHGHDNGMPPARPDGDGAMPPMGPHHHGAQPPAMPDGDNAQPPAMPDGDNTQPPANSDANNAAPDDRHADGSLDGEQPPATPNDEAAPGTSDVEGNQPPAMPEGHANDNGGQQADAQDDEADLDLDKVSFPAFDNENGPKHAKPGFDFNRADSVNQVEA